MSPHCHIDYPKHTSPYHLAEEFSERTNRCLFITGKAGTGKTTFLKHLRDVSLKNMAVVAPTGVAAINAGGMTIHSFFQLPIRTLVPTPQSYKQMFAEQRMMQRKRQMLYHLEMLVIDEISMVRADVLDAIDAVLKHYRFRHNEPFGGVQVVMIGDLMQLQPVVHGDDDRELMARYYEGPYFFQSKVLQQVQPVYIELDHVFRQQNEQFVRLLNEVRENRLSDEGRKMLAARYKPQSESNGLHAGKTKSNNRYADDDFHITLTTHNQQADNINHCELDELSGKLYTFKAEVQRNFPESSYPTEETLLIKEGARVMFIRNDEQKPRRFYNGKLGIVRGIDDDEGTILVGCDDGDIEVEPMTWENIRYRENATTGKIQEELLGTFTQYPLRLAWAITIHKSQGLTFDRVIIDAARAFAAGQVYVALSRCRTLEGIVLSSPLQRVGLGNDRQVLDYVNSQPTTEQSGAQLSRAEKEYQLQLFSELYSVSTLLSMEEQIERHVAKCVSFNAETMPFLGSLRELLKELVPVSEKFQRQLAGIIVGGKRLELEIMSQESEFKNQEDAYYLQQRMDAAAGYFVPKVALIAQRVSTHPCRCKNKDDAADFDTMMADLFLVLTQKAALMQKVAKEATTEAYLKAKSRFAVSEMDTATAFEKPETKSKTAKKSKQKNLTFSTKSKIKKDSTEPDVNKGVVNDIRQLLHKEKAVKKSTYEQTYELYKEGKTPEQIAELRGLTLNTIIGHLARYVRQGQILITDIVPKNIVNKILNARAENPELSSLKEFNELLGGEVPYSYLRAVLESYNML
ncbi:MAG: helix-turn-helix domain-containing protein [Paludibacteraceae bacterium]|nr:helix-turn-helix domain-containing protein [Paludibacteraceae bacterium]